MKSLSEIYNLSYDTSDFNSGLINWYNRLIDKSVNELNVADVSKMIRQDILKNLAMQKAIDLFLRDPYEGEYNDGDLLKTLIVLDISSIDKSKLKDLSTLVEKLKYDYVKFEWTDEDMKNQYADNLELLSKKMFF